MIFTGICRVYIDKCTHANRKITWIPEGGVAENAAGPPEPAAAVAQEVAEPEAAAAAGPQERKAMAATAPLMCRHDLAGRCHRPAQEPAAEVAEPPVAAEVAAEVAEPAVAAAAGPQEPAALAAPPLPMCRHYLAGRCHRPAQCKLAASVCRTPETLKAAHRQLAALPPGLALPLHAWVLGCARRRPGNASTKLAFCLRIIFDCEAGGREGGRQARPF